MRFVILSLARSGTSLLTSTLNTHPAILCHGEVYHPQPRWHLLGNLSDLSEEEKRALQGEPDFLQRIYDQDRPVVGHKMWYGQNPSVCDALMADESILKIIHERENGLAQFASGKLAQETGVWNLNAGSRATVKQAPELSFSSRAFDQFLAHRQESLHLYRSRSRGPVLNLTYRDLVEGRFDLVLNFLGQRPVDLLPQKKKLHTSDILSRFVANKDRASVLRRLDAIGHPEWVTE